MRVRGAALLVVLLSAWDLKAAPLVDIRPIEQPAPLEQDVRLRVDSILRSLRSGHLSTTALVLDLDVAARLRVRGVDASVALGVPVVAGVSDGDAWAARGVKVGDPVVGAGVWACVALPWRSHLRIYVGGRATVDTTQRPTFVVSEDTQLLRNVALYDMSYRPGEVFSADSSVRGQLSVRWERRGSALQFGGIVGTSNRLGGDEDLDAPRSFVGMQVGAAARFAHLAVIGEGFVTCAGNPCYASLHLGLRIPQAPALTLHVSHFEGRDADEPGNAIGVRFEAAP